MPIVTMLKAANLLVAKNACLQNSSIWLDAALRFLAAEAAFEALFVKVVLIFVEAEEVLLNDAERACNATFKLLVFFVEVTKIEFIVCNFLVTASTDLADFGSILTLTSAVTLPSSLLIVSTTGLRFPGALRFICAVKLNAW